MMETVDRVTMLTYQSRVLSHSNMSKHHNVDAGHVKIPTHKTHMQITSVVPTFRRIFK